MRRKRKERSDVNKSITTEDRPRTTPSITPEPLPSKIDQMKAKENVFAENVQISKDHSLFDHEAKQSASKSIVTHIQIGLITSPECSKTPFLPETSQKVERKEVSGFQVPTVNLDKTKVLSEQSHAQDET